MRVIILLVLATSVGVFFSRQEEGSTPRGGLAWMRLVIYWLFTITISFEMVAGALWDLMKLEFVKAASAHLGYPEYMGTIIGVPRIPCALALLAPMFPRLKNGPTREHSLSIWGQLHHNTSPWQGRSNGYRHCFLLRSR
jgi:hypothetical protein